MLSTFWKRALLVNNSFPKRNPQTWYWHYKLMIWNGTYCVLEKSSSYPTYIIMYAFNIYCGIDEHRISHCYTSHKPMMHSFSIGIPKFYCRTALQISTRLAIFNSKLLPIDRC